jgi:hypothetical protein
LKIFKRKSITPLEQTNAFKVYISYNGWGSIAELAELEKDRRV